MPDGTIQDSRNPYSPQWGYLKVRDPNSIEIAPDERCCKNDTWNEYVLFLNPLAKRFPGNEQTPINFYKRHVTFEMEEAEITTKRGKTKMQVAVITRLLNCEGLDYSSTECEENESCKNDH